MPLLEQLPEDHIYQAYGIYLLKSQHRVIRRLKKDYQPSVHGHRAWNSSFLLMDYLEAKPIRRGAKVIEVGCGWGAAAVFCAARFDAKVTGLDIDRDVFPFLEALADLNDVGIDTLTGKFETLSGRSLGGFHTILGSDICFWDSMVKPLVNLVSRAFRGGARRCVFTDPGRPTFHEFVELCEKRHKVERLDWYSLEPNRFQGEVVDISPGSRYSRRS